MKLYIIVITAQLLKQQLSSGVHRLPLCTSVVKAWRWLSDGLGFGGLPGSVGAPADEAIPRPVPDTLPYPIPTPLPAPQTPPPPFPPPPAPLLPAPQTHPPALFPRP